MKRLPISKVGKRELTKKEKELCARIALGDKKVQKTCERVLLSESKQGEIGQRLKESAASPFAWAYFLGWVMMLAGAGLIVTIVLMPLLLGGLGVFGTWSVLAALIIGLSLGFGGMLLFRSTSPSY